MQVILFVLGTFVVQGGLVLLIMWLLTAGDREAAREEARLRLAALEAKEEGLRRAA